MMAFPITAAASSSAGGGFLSSLGSIAGGLLGGLGSFFGQKDANAMNWKIAKRQMEFQERMSNTAYTRAAADLEHAGLNRILALGHPASSPGGAGAVMQNALGAGVNSALGAARLSGEVRNLREQAELLKKQQLVAETQARQNEANTGLAYANQNSVNADNFLKHLKNMVYVENPNLMKSQLTLQGNTAQQLLGALGEVKERVKDSLKKEDVRKNLDYGEEWYRRNQR